MNHFMARLIFCFFAEDTDIFTGDDLFTATIEQMSERDSSNTHEVISELFRAMNTKTKDRAAASIAALGRRVSLRERRAVLGQHGRAALQPRSRAPTCCTSAISTGRRSTPTSSAR